MTCQNSNLLCYLYLYLFCYWLLFCYPSADNLVPDQHLISCTCEHAVTFDWSGYRASSSWYFAKPSCSIIWSKLYYQIEGQVPYNDFRSGCPKKMTLLKDHFVILAALRSHGQTVQTALLSRFVGQYARRLSTHKISCFIGLPGALPWLPFTIRPFCMDVSNMSTGTWTCGGMWSSAVSPDFGYGSGIFDSQHGLSDRFADCCTDMVTAFVGGRDGGVPLLLIQRYWDKILQPVSTISSQSSNSVLQYDNVHSNRLGFIRHYLQNLGVQRVDWPAGKLING